MGKVKNYLLAIAGLVILGGAVQFVRPLQAEPPAIANTPFGDETMIITIVEDLTQADETEFDAVDVSGFRFVAFHVKTGTGGSSVLFYRFSTQAGRFNDAIPKTGIAMCRLTAADGAECPTSTPHQSHRVAGSFLLVQLQDANNTTLQVFLSR